MLITKKKQVTKVVDEIVDQYVECDKCHQRIKIDMYDAFECSVIFKTGDAYPEGGCGEEIEINLCQECGDKLIDMLSSDGYRINKRDWDY